MKIATAMAKTNKYAVSASGDSAEVVERPLGGLSVLVVDGQGSGQGAKRLSTAIVGRAAAMINDGARDGAVARTVHDWLFAQRQGKVSASLIILSVATDTDTLVITRSGNCPALVWTGSRVLSFEEQSPPLGFYRYSRPQVDQVDLRPGMAVAGFTDGILNAGSRNGKQMPFASWAELFSRACNQTLQPEDIAEAMLQHALELDDGRPGDDMTVIVMSLLDVAGGNVRRLRVEYPLGD